MMQQPPRFLRPGDTRHGWEAEKPDLDPENNTTFVFNPNISKSIDQQRKRLPIFNVRNHIIYLMENFQTLVICGETGSGKSTQIPQYLIEAGWCRGGHMVGITEPRRVAATALATRVADERGTIVGDEVGYCIRFDDHTKPGLTQIKYMTEGILVCEMMADPLLRSYSVVMLDEVHERTLYTDVVLGLMKKIIKKRPDLRLIVSSATMDAEEISDYFNVKKDGKDTSIILSIPGRTFPIEVFYIRDPVPDYVRASVETAMRIHRLEEAGDILMFLTGQEEVDSAVSLIKQEVASLRKSKYDVLVLPMYGALPAGEQLRVFLNPGHKTRKIVVATNIAETSITIPGIVYVVDCGFVKLRCFNAKTRNDSLVIVPISRAEAQQRAGRAGRLRSGRVFRLYSEDAYEKLTPHLPCEMQRTDLAPVVLQLKALGIENILRFPFLSRPPAQHMILALDLLYALGAINDDGNLADPLGLQMAELPLDPKVSKMLLSSGEFGCTEEILTLVAMLQINNVFQRPSSGNRALEARRKRREFEVAEGDLITLLNVYNAFIKEKKSKQWCGVNFLNYKGLMRACEIRSSMAGLLRKFGVPSSSAAGDVQAVCRCITAGFFPNAAYLHHSGTYHTVRGEPGLHIHPTSVLYTEEQPQWILYAEVIHSSKIYVRDVTVIDPSWLEELAPHYYEKRIERPFSL